jgi:hypothetical protein
VGEQAKSDVELPRFWRWFFRGTRGKPPGWRKFLDRWLGVHAVIGVAAAMLLPVTLSEAAKSVLLPLAGILVGMSFAWVGSAQAIVQTVEIEKLADAQGGGIENYVFTFQSAILAILVTLCLWGLAGLGVFDQPCPWPCPAWLYPAARGLLFFIASLTLRECWQVVMGAQMLLLAQRKIAKLPSSKQPDPEGGNV